MKQLAILFFLSISCVSFAQSRVNIEPGNITIIKDSRVDTLVNLYRAMSVEKSSIPGYRIQVAAGANRSALYNLRAKFNSTFPDIKNSVVYQQPNFKLRVGNYRNKLDAQKDLLKILAEFTDAFIIRDEIKIEEFFQ